MPYRRIDLSILKRKEADEIGFRDFEDCLIARARDEDCGSHRTVSIP